MSALGILVRDTSRVKWRHVAEALIAGFAANYVWPRRISELFRADYARRVFEMSRFTASGTIMVACVSDGIGLVEALWTTIVWWSFARSISDMPSWVVAVATTSAILSGIASIVISSRFEMRWFGARAGIAARGDRLVVGLSSVSRGHAATVSFNSIGIWALEAVALNSIVRSFTGDLSHAEIPLLLGLASLSTLLPNAPEYLPTFELLIGYAFKVFGHSQTLGIIAATTIQRFFFGAVTILGGLVLLSRSGVILLRPLPRPLRIIPQTTPACGLQSAIRLRSDTGTHVRLPLVLMQQYARVDG